jgi:hypothetical protein
MLEVNVGGLLCWIRACVKGEGAAEEIIISDYENKAS